MLTCPSDELPTGKTERQLTHSEDLFNKKSSDILCGTVSRG
jgi:hypothetical protein